jgi:hypothetical protein
MIGNNFIRSRDESVGLRGLPDGFCDTVRVGTQDHPWGPQKQNQVHRDPDTFKGSVVARKARDPLEISGTFVERIHKNKWSLAAF